MESSGPTDERNSLARNRNTLPRDVRILPASRWSSWTWVLVVLLTALIAAMTVFKIADLDVWWHLKTGEYIISHRAIPTHDVFSYTALGHPWITHEWLFEVLLFCAYRLGSLPGVVIFKTLIVLLAFLFTFLSIRRLGGYAPRVGGYAPHVGVGAVIATPLLILAAFLVTFRAFERPHVATECLLALYLFVLLSYKYLPSVRARRNRLWLLLPVQLLWANIHSGMVLGFGLVALFAAAQAGQYVLARRGIMTSDDILQPDDIRFLLVLSLGSFGISFVNPNLHKAVLYSVIITRETIFAGHIGELQSSFAPDFRNTDFFVCFLLLLGGGLVSFVLNYKRLQLFGLLVFLVAALAAVMALRNLPIFGLLAVPLVAVNIRQIAERASARRHPSARAQRIWALLAASLPVFLCTCALVLVFTRGVRVPNDFRKPGFGLDQRIFPVRAANFIARNRIDGNIFSTMQYGGYLIWRWYPEHPVFIDGRLDVYGRELYELYGRLFWSSPDLDSIFERYSIKCCLLPQPPSNLPGTEHYVGRTMATRPDWSLVYWDDLALVYLRDSPANRPLIARNAYRAVIPLLLGLPGRDSSGQEMLDEALRAARDLPASPLAQNVLGVAYAQLGRQVESREAFNRALALDPMNPEALLGLGVGYARSDSPPEAAAAFKKLLKLQPGNSMALLNLGMVSAQAGKYEQAERYLLEATRVNPQLVPAYSALGDIYYQQNLLDAARQMWETVLSIDPDNELARSRLEQTK